jgi:hypothetical protein
MITDFIFVIFQLIAKAIILLLPTSWIPSVIPIDWSFMKHVYLFISPSVFLIISNTFILFIIFAFTWSIIEWVYKKIPGVN